MCVATSPPARARACLPTSRRLPSRSFKTRASSIVFQRREPRSRPNRQGFRTDNRLHHYGRTVSGRPKKRTSGLTYDDLRREVKEGRIEPLYLFVGEEQYLHDRALRLLYDTVD